MLARGSIGHDGGPHLWVPRPTATFADILGSDLKFFVDAEDDSKTTAVSGAVSSYAEAISGASIGQSTAASRPAIVTGPAGRQVWRFDGVDDCLEIAGIPSGVPTGANPFTAIFIGFQTLTVDASGTNRSIVTWGTSGLTGAASLRRATSAGQNIVQASVGNGTTQLVANSAGDFLGASFARIFADGTDIYGALNGLAGAATACVPGLGTTRLRVGANNSNTPGSLAQMDLSAILIVAAAGLSAATMNALHVAAGPRIFG
ncbi:MAG: hypothetical protein KIS73_23050 [Enhydrobacter sp.]|nr:hypothetical protein [Enhydrobacter sp.]